MVKVPEDRSPRCLPDDPALCKLEHVNCWTFQILQEWIFGSHKVRGPTSPGQASRGSSYCFSPASSPKSPTHRFLVKFKFSSFHLMGNFHTMLKKLETKICLYIFYYFLFLSVSSLTNASKLFLVCHCPFAVLTGIEVIKFGVRFSKALALWQFGYQFSSVAQSCRTLRDTMDCSLPGSSVHGIF